MRGAACDEIATLSRPGPGFELVLRLTTRFVELTVGSEEFWLRLGFLENWTRKGPLVLLEAVSPCGFLSEAAEIQIQKLVER